MIVLFQYNHQEIWGKRDGQLKFQSFTERYGGEREIGKRKVGETERDCRERWRRGEERSDDLGD